MKLPALFISLALLSGVAVAADQKLEYTIEIKEHIFSPADLEVPAGEKFSLIVKNLDATAEEFESHDLKREKIVQGNSEIKVNIGPLKPGTYKYFGEFHEDIAKGTITAVDKKAAE